MSPIQAAATTAGTGIDLTGGQLGLVAGVALILGIDRFMSEARALTNLIGNGVATVVVGKWCGSVDEAKLHERLGPASAELKLSSPR